MSRKKIITLIVCLTIALVSWTIWNIYYILPIDKARPQIQAFLDKTYNNEFEIVAIEKDYCQDLFHQPWGYKLILGDSNNIEFGHIKIQFNEYQKSWITYGGTNIEKEYEKAKEH